MAESINSSRIIKLGNEISLEQIRSWETSKELRNTPDLWIFVCVFVPENDSCLSVDILASLFEEASLSFLCTLVSALQKLVLAGKILGEKRVASALQAHSGSLDFPSPLLSVVLETTRCRSARALAK